MQAFSGKSQMKSLDDSKVFFETKASLEHVFFDDVQGCDAIDAPLEWMRFASDVGEGDRRSYSYADLLPPPSGNPPEAPVVSHIAVDYLDGYSVQIMKWVNCRQAMISCVTSKCSKITCNVLGNSWPVQRIVWLLAQRLIVGAILQPASR